MVLKSILLIILMILLTGCATYHIPDPDLEYNLREDRWEIVK